MLVRYAGNRGQANDLAIEASSIGDGILELLNDRSHWEGTARDLLAELEARNGPERTKKLRDWPSNPQAIGKALRRIAPNLRQTGIDVQFNRSSGKGRRRLIILEKLDILSSEMSEPSEDVLNKAVLNPVSNMSDNRIQNNSYGVVDNS